MDQALLLNNENQTLKIATIIGQNLSPQSILTFEGELGAGKTTLIRYILQALGVKDKIKSPSFSIVESYELTNPIYHFDLYRIQDKEELDFLGFDDYFTKNSICLIEWPEIAKHKLQLVDINFKLNIENDKKRLLDLKAFTPKGKNILLKILEEG